MFYGNLQNLVIKSKSVRKSSSVISSQIGVMSDQFELYKLDQARRKLFKEGIKEARNLNYISLVRRVHFVGSIFKDISRRFGV